jgi:hypothetical protein
MEFGEFGPVAGFRHSYRRQVSLHVSVLQRRDTARVIIGQGDHPSADRILLISMESSERLSLSRRKRFVHPG